MSTVTTRRRRASWTVPQWAAFARRARAVRDRIGALVGEFPETRGLKPLHIGGLIRAQDRLHRAMLAAEHLFVDQHPDRNPDAIAFIHGPPSTSWGVCSGRVKRDAPILTRAEWTALGDRFKAIRADLMVLLMDFQQTAPLVRSRRWSRAIDTFDRARSPFDSLVHAQHPDWADAPRVFYGRRAAGGN